MCSFIFLFFHFKYNKEIIKRKRENELENLFSRYWKREGVWDRREERQVIEEGSGSLLRKKRGKYTHWAEERYKGIVEMEERGVEFVEELYAMWDMGKNIFKKN